MLLSLVCFRAAWFDPIGKRWGLESKR